MLGSRTEADDAVQETWLRLNRTDPDRVENLGGWLTTVIAGYAWTGCAPAALTGRVRRGAACR